MGEVQKRGDGRLFIVSAPSGAGKTSLVKRLLSETVGLCVSVSHTTRPKRPGDQDGQDYHFVDRDQFTMLIEQGRFLEYAEVFGNYYGTSIDAVEQHLKDGEDVILEIDWQGAEQVRNQRNDVIWIFILPPSRAALVERLKARAQDSDEVMARRTQEAVSEMQQYHRADYLVINDDFEQALIELKSIVVADRVTKARQAVRHGGLITSLINA